MPNVVNVILYGILKPTHLLLDNGFERAALVLLYSGMDAMTFMNLPAGQTGSTRKDYIAWAEQYIRFPCHEQLTGVELYAARCGVLHTFTPDSDLSRKGKARRIVYVNQHTPEVRYDAAVASDVVVVSVHGLYTAFVNGVQQFLKDLRTDSARETLALERLDKMFHDMPQDSGSK
jgi:hypothetical protein